MQNMKKKSLKQNFLWTFVGNSILSLTQFGILIVLAKVGTPTVVGEYSLALAISSPIFIFFNLKLRSAQATDKNNEYSFSDYYSLRTIANIFAMATIIVILFLSDYSLHMSLIILLISVLKLDRKSTRLNSSHVSISYAVFCLKKKIIYKLNASTLLSPLDNTLLDLTQSLLNH